jgi:hypothetical protein
VGQAAIAPRAAGSPERRAQPGWIARGRLHAVVLAVVWLASDAYVSRFVATGWIPHDEGLLAHSAERVLAGERPHRDFDEVYTGGLSELHAAAFAVLGTDLLSLREVVFGAFIATVPLLYAIAARFASPPIAGMVVLLCVAGTLPNYFAAVPSWYVLFLVVFGVDALLRYVETDRRRWAFVAGLWGGVAVVVKSVGAFYLVGAALAVLYRAGEETAGEARFSAFVVLEAIALAALCAAVIALIGPAITAMDAVQFVVPVVALSALVVAMEATRGGGFRRRATRIAPPLLALGAGAAVPVAVFLASHVVDGGLADVWRDVLVLPQRRLRWASFPLPPLWTLVAAVRRARIVTAVVGAGLAAVLLVAVRPPVYRTIWWSLRPLVPAVVALACLGLVSPSGGLRGDALGRARLVVLVAVLGCMNLTQFPYASGTYFCYLWPLVVLAIAALVAMQPAAPKALHACVLGFYLAFTVAVLNRGNVRAIGVFWAERGPLARLTLDRASLVVHAGEAAVYERVVAEVRKHAAPGTFIYAAPDCPQVYFLSGRRDSQRTLYDFLDPDFGDRPVRRRRILTALESHGVDVVVINELPEFSGALDPELLAALATRYPAGIRIPPFTVRWRTPPAAAPATAAPPPAAPRS